MGLLDNLKGRAESLRDKAEDLVDEVKERLEQRDDAPEGEDDTPAVGDIPEPEAEDVSDEDLVADDVSLADAGDAPVVDDIPVDAPVPDVTTDPLAENAAAEPLAEDTVGDNAPAEADAGVADLSSEPYEPDTLAEEDAVVTDVDPDAEPLTESIGGLLSGDEVDRDALLGAVEDQQPGPS